MLPPRPYSRHETDLAFEWLERAYAQRDASLCEIKRLTAFRPLQGRSAVGRVPTQDAATRLGRRSRGLVLHSQVQECAECPLLAGQRRSQVDP